MESLNSMFQSLSPGMQNTIILIVVISLIAIIVLVFLKLFRIALGIAIFLLIVPTLFTVFFGDGHEIVKDASQYFDEETGQQITEAYDYYKEKDSELPGLNTDKISEDWNLFKDNISIPESPAPDEVVEETDE